MTELTENIARKEYEKYVDAGLKMFPPFKGFGMMFVQFAIDEPEMFRCLFMKESKTSDMKFLEEQIEMDRILPYICASLELNEPDAMWLFRNMTIVVYGIALMCVTGICMMQKEDIAKYLGEVCRGLLMQLKASDDRRTALIPTTEAKSLGRVEEYVKERDCIIGYGEDREMFHIKLDAILYFEAVGENVFAYTKGNVFEIKLRLYQVEEKVEYVSFVRASKSLLVNLKKIVSIAPENGGRGKLKLVNGETVVASRAYMKNVTERMKDLAK